MERTEAGTMLSLEGNSLGLALGALGSLLLIPVLLLSMDDLDLAEKIEAVVLVVTMVSAGGYFLGRFLRRRNLRSASVVLARWPLRLGSVTRVRFEKWLRRGAKTISITARLVCIEKAIVRSGRYSDVRTVRRHESLLVTGGLESRPKRVIAEWDVAIPRWGFPSFAVENHSVRWFLETVTHTDRGDVEADFELLVIPEVVE